MEIKEIISLENLQRYTSKVVDLIKKSTHTHSNKDVLDATTASFTTTLETKLDGIAEKANNYSHPTSSGNKHIPSGGSSGQILRWSADGTAAWGADNNTTYSDATTSAHGLMTASDKKKLDGIATGAQVNTITGIKGNAEGTYRTGNVNITPDNIGAVALSEKGAASGVVPLNSSSLIDSKYLPSYVDDVLEYASKKDFPATGETGKIYVDTSSETNNTYRWSGSMYVNIAKCDNTTYKLSKNGSTITLTGSDGSVTTASDSDTTYGVASTTAQGLMSAADKAKLDGIASGANKITVDSSMSSSSTNPVQNKVVNVALGNKLNTSGGIITGKISRSSGGSWISARDNAVVANTSYGQTAGSSYNPTISSKTTLGSWSIGNLSGEESLSFSYDTDVNYTSGTNSNTRVLLPNTSGVIALTSQLPTVNNPTITVKQAGTTKATFTLNQSGNTTIELADSDTTYGAATTSANGLMSSGDKSKLNGIASGAEVNQNAFSNVKVGNTTIVADGKTDTLTLAGSNVTLTSDATNDKVTIGITKANVTSALGYTPPTTNTTYGLATTSANGLMSSSDKTKLDSIANNANNYSHPTSSGYKHIPSGGSSGQILRWSADGTAVWGADNNTTYSNQSLGNGYGTCNTATSTTAKVGSLSGYALVVGGKPTIKFDYAVPASATLNINGKGAKAIYYNNKAIVADIIAAGDKVTFIYDGSYYHVIAIDKMSRVTQTIENSSDTVPSGAAITSKLNKLPDSYLTYTVLSTIS